METENKIKNKKIETYAEDMARVIESDTGGLIKKIIHEQEEYETERKNLSPGSKKNKIFIFTSILFMLLTFSLLIFLGVIKRKVNTVDVLPQYIPPIFIDQNYFKEIDGLTKEQIVQSVLNEVNNTNLKAGGIEGIYLTENKKIISFKRFIEVIQGNFDVAGLPFVDDSFLIGASNENTEAIPSSKNINLFFLFKVRSFPDIFDWLRSWENKLFSDLHGFLKIDISPDTKYLITKFFEDDLIVNKNARILKNKDSNIVMTYIFADNNFIVITGSEKVAAEVILRLKGSQIKK